MATTTNKLPVVSNKTILAKGVSALADRPNMPGQYGQSGLSSASLKAWFDNLAKELVTAVQGISNAFNGEDAGTYIRMALDDYGGVNNLKDLENAFISGDFADKILHVLPAANAPETKALQDVIDTFAQEISTVIEQMPLVRNRTIAFGKTLDFIENNIYHATNKPNPETINSLKPDSLNRPAKVSDKLTLIGITADDPPVTIAMSAEVVGFAEDKDGTQNAVFRANGYQILYIEPLVFPYTLSVYCPPGTNLENYETEHEKAYTNGTLCKWFNRMPRVGDVCTMILRSTSSDNRDIYFAGVEITEVATDETTKEPSAAFQAFHIKRINAPDEVVDTAILEVKGYTDKKVGAVQNTLDKLQAEVAGKQDELTFNGTYNETTNPVATVSTVTTEIAKVVGNAPDALNTLEEIAAWIKAHPDSVAAINAKIESNTTAIAANTQGIKDIKDKQTEIEETAKKADENATAAYNTANGLSESIDNAVDTANNASSIVAGVLGTVNNLSSQVAIALEAAQGAQKADDVEKAKQEAIETANGYTDALGNTLNTTIDDALTTANNYTEDEISKAAETINGRIAETKLDIMELGEKIPNLEQDVASALEVAQGAQKSIVFNNYWEMHVDDRIQSGTKETFNIGQNIYIKTVGVPDLWVFSYNEFGDEPDWTQDTIDTVLVDELKEKGTVQVGRWLLAQLETGKVVLGDYASTEYVDEAISESQVKIVRLI